jgi:hypothetical protein
MADPGRGQARGTERRLEKVAACLSGFAGIIHFAAGPGHLAEWWAYGLFFFAAAVAQAGYALVVWTRGIELAGGWDAVRGRVYLAGIAMTLGIIAIWVVSRTVGVPFGPEAFEAEGIGVLDAASKVVEAALVLVLARLWLSARTGPEAPAPA